MNFFKKWYTYQKERFPILTYGSYCFCIVFGTFCFSSCCKSCNLLGEECTLNYILLIPMFFVGILQFLMVRIIDEFKDYEEDSKYRPYRPVPRGLITLKELKVLFIICAILQLTITFIVNPKSLILLLVVWLFFATMSKGFFIKKVLDKHILLEVLLDEFLLPFTVLYLSSFVCEFLPENIWQLLLFTYIVSWIIEIARKIRCKEAEEKGVKTYTAVFGIPKATLLLCFLETLLFALSIFIIGFNIYVTVGFGIIELINFLFIFKQTKILSKCVEYLADIYVMGLLVSMVTLIK